MSSHKWGIGSLTKTGNAHSCHAVSGGYLWWHMSVGDENVTAIVGEKSPTLPLTGYLPFYKNRGAYSYERLLSHSWP
jgi:hypothetical protein